MNKKNYYLKTIIICGCIFLGYVLPTRKYYYPFVKFPMYGYSKSKDELVQRHIKTTLFFNDESGVVIDPFEYGFSRDHFNQIVISPFLTNDTLAIYKLIDNTKLIYPKKKLCKIEVEQIIYNVSNSGLEEKSRLIKVKYVK